MAVSRERAARSDHRRAGWQARWREPAQASAQRCPDMDFALTLDSAWGMFACQEGGWSSVGGRKMETIRVTEFVGCLLAGARAT